VFGFYYDYADIVTDGYVLNQRPARGIAFCVPGFFMKTYNSLFYPLISFENLQSAYEKAKLHKMSPEILEFGENLYRNILLLMHELWTKTYQPMPLRKFILRDPKTRVICISDFRDRVVHHA